MDIRTILQTAVEKQASDVFIITGLPLTYKVEGRQLREETPLGQEDTQNLITEIYTIARRDKETCLLARNEDDDFSFAVAGMGRFRANVLRQRGSFAAVLRIIHFGLPKPEDMGIPEIVMQAADAKNGLVLVTGPAGNGKSTTLACMIDKINHTRDAHIITMEDPIEYIHPHARCIVTQREIPSDIPTYIAALRSALRESPDIILLGEMRDKDTIETAMTAAETGQLLFSTLHTTGAANTVDRIVDVFPPSQQQQIRIQLSMVLRAVISQQLVPTVDGRQVPAFEIMYANTAIKNLIREAKTHQIDSAISANAAQGMCTMDASLLKLCREGVISKDTARTYCQHIETMEAKLAAI